MPHRPGNDLNLGILPGRDASLLFPRTARDKHLYVCGGTGTGKSKFLESLIRQDIKSWRQSKCGMLVLDPHGSLYDSLMEWLAWHKIDRPIIPIDLRQDDWVVSYNLLRQRKELDPAVLIDNITDAMAYVWGAGGTDQTPLFARWVGNIIRTLYEQKLTIIESEYLIDRIDKQMRYLLTHDLDDKSTRQDWRFANTLNPRDFEAQIGSTVNRLQRFIRNQTMRTMFGLSGPSLDLRRSLDEGHIILVSLATERAKVSKENAELFATLLLSDLWTAAQERGKREGVKPFYCYLDEFQRFITPTIADNLDEARGYGIHMTMAHQFPNQLLDRGENGRRVYNSIMENASSKVVFRLTHEENLSVMAKWLFMGVMNPDEIKHELYSTKVMEYREELKEVWGYGKSSGSSHGSQAGRSSGHGSGGTESYFGDGVGADGPRGSSFSESDFSAESSSESESHSESTSESVSYVPTLVPVLGKELSHVQFRSLEEQLFRSMAVLFDQKERHGVARLVGMSAPVSIKTPTVEKMPAKEERTKLFLASCCARYSFAMRGAKARRLLEARAATLSESIVNQLAPEPNTSKRKI
ncbi:MAG TPA: type IV secretion system DNA-binding domain-containing protein [Lacipirellulaceae bacterium]|nr:type IV secretion system DNA-binding domain-containing protein [Lacipirellulaceae bacterium]